MIGKIADLNRLQDKTYEPPIPMACNAEIYAQYAKSAFPMRWDNELSKQEMSIRLAQTGEKSQHGPFIPLSTPGTITLTLRRDSETATANPL